MQAHGRVEGIAARVFDRARNAQLAHVAVGGVVVNVEGIAGLEQGFFVFVQFYADVFDFLGVEQVAAENVGHGIHAFFQAACIVDGFADGESVVEGKRAAEGVAHLAVDGDAGHVAVLGERHDVDHIAAL